VDGQSVTLPRRRRWRHALVASAALAVAIGAAVFPATAASADTLYGPYMFQNSPTGLCLDLAGGTAVPYAMIRSWSCNGSSAQKWYFDSSNDTLKLVSNTNWCLDVYHSGTSEETPVDLYMCNGTGAQQWLWEESPTGGGTILLNPNSGLCLNIPGQNPNEGTQLWLWACNPNPMQYWNAVGQV
jgi:hypothetical protein